MNNISVHLHKSPQPGVSSRVNKKSKYLVIYTIFTNSFSTNVPNILHNMLKDISFYWEERHGCLIQQSETFYSQFCQLNAFWITRCQLGRQNYAGSIFTRYYCCEIVCLDNEQIPPIQNTGTNTDNTDTKYWL